MHAHRHPHIQIYRYTYAHTHIHTHSHARTHTNMNKHTSQTHMQGNIHLSRVELFLQEIGRREPLYFQQRAIDEKDSEYADNNYAEHYYKVQDEISRMLNSVHPPSFYLLHCFGAISQRPFLLSLDIAVNRFICT